MHRHDSRTLGATMTDELGWLIELKSHHNNPPTWWGISANGKEWAWVTDSMQAVRFAREIDAQRVIAAFGWMNCLATEHLWTDG